jgi:hypothetical protein
MGKNNKYNANKYNISTYNESDKVSNYTDSDQVCEISDNYKPMHENDQKCAPSKEFNNGSCIPLDLLVILANAYNKSVGKPIVKVDDKYMKCSQKYKQYLLKKLSKEIKRCKDQKCWIEQDFAKYIEKDKFLELATDVFRPDAPNGPQGKFTWLNTININNVMRQYESKYSDFKFLEAVPMDFADINYHGFSKNDLLKLKQSGITKIGVIFNLDFHNQSGSHWVALYCDFNKKKIYFSDSVGGKPHKRVYDFINILKDTIYSIHYGGNNTDKAVIDRTVSVKINTTQHQRGGSECGVYSLNFIIRLLDGDSFEEISTKRIPDEEINRMRDVYFTDNPKY